ncbi:MAG: T9SS C-terminal target domain-containing protein, partial [Bacteroidetes bacterium QH_2_63_10]
MTHSRLLFLLALFVLGPTSVAAQPTGLDATAGSGQVSLTWQGPNVEEGDTLACYRVYRDTTSIPDGPDGQTELRIAEIEPPEDGSPSLVDPGLSNDTTYFYRVTAETGETEEGTVSCGGTNADESSFSNEVSATPFPPTELQITDPEIPVSQPVDAGTAVEVTVQGTNVPSEETVGLQFRQGGSSSFTTLTMTQDGTEFTASIPGAQVTARGVEFIVATRNEGGGDVRAPSDGVASVRVTSEDLSFTQPGGTAQTGYRMVTYPGQLDDPQLSTLFETLTPYDRSEWRLFAIGPEGLSADGSYVEQENLGETLGTGQGLWLITQSGTTLGPVQGTSLRTDQPYEIPLREGWNLIGNPFAFEVPVSQLRVTNSAGTLQDILGYDGTFFSEDGGVLKPYQGYLIRLSNGQSGTLVIDPTREINPSNGRDPASAESAVPQATWQVDVVVQIEQARDKLNPFGVAPGARAGMDRADGHEPPPV